MYYDIADHLIGIECDNASVMEALQGFTVFRTFDKVHPEIFIHLEKTEPQSISGKLYYTINTEGIVCIFYKIPMDMVWKLKKMRI